VEICSKRAVILLFFLVLSIPLGFSAEIRGRISVEPPYPVRERIEVVKKTKDSCADTQYSQELMVSSEGGLKNAVVFLKGDFPEGWPENTKVPELDQRGCVFTPHVLIVPTGMPFKVKNSDPLAHDIRSFQDARMLSRFEMDEYSEAQAESFKNAGIHVIRCGLHPWMYAFAVSAPHPFYAVSDDAGQFMIADVPEGDYVLKLWHETLGEAEVSLKVEQPVQEFTYTFKNKA
jgi:hypothetical protein